MYKRLKLVVVLSCLCVLVLTCIPVAQFLLKEAGADTPGPASIVSATIQAPQSGGNVYVNATVNGSANQMQGWGRSVTRDNLLNGGTPQWYTLTYSPNQSGYAGSLYGNVQAAYGDLIEIKATNFYYQSWTDIEQVGYVPAGSDTAPPDFTTSYMSATWSINVFTLTLNAYYAIYDPSYPITVTLSDNDNPSNKTTTILYSPSDQYPKLLTLTVGTGEKVRLTARDNYGNLRSMFYITNQLAWSAATGSYSAEPTQAGAERTRNQAVAAIGVQLHNGSFVHSEELFKLRGKVLATVVDGVYRSRASYDGSFGRNWDSILSSRIQFVNGDVNWWPGNGRQELFTYQPFPSPGYWVSPIGLFAKFTGSAGVYTITFVNGLKYTYENNNLKTIQDAHNNTIQLIRDGGGRVFRILDDLNRVYELYYYDHKRLAEVVDYMGASILFEYNSSGNLVKIIDEAGYERRFDYQASSPWMMIKLYDRNSRAYLENTYEVSGNRISSQKVPADASAAYSINYSGLGGSVVVTDPNGTVQEHYMDPATEYVLTSVRTLANSTLRTKVANGYDWNLVPNWVEHKRNYNLQNYLPSRTWIEWCPSAGGCPGGAGVLKTPYTWYDYYSTVQDEPSDDPRGFGNLKLIRRDKTVDDSLRTGASIRESWTYEANFNNVVAHWEERAWRLAASAVENQDPATWDATLGAQESPPATASPFKTTYTYDGANGALLSVTYPNSSQPESQTGITHTYSYSSSGQILTHAEPSSGTDDPGVLTQYMYYTTGLQKGLLQKRWIDMPGSVPDVVETYEYDALGRKTARIDANGQRWTTTYDAIDRILTEVTPVVVVGGYNRQFTTTNIFTLGDLTEVRFTNQDHTGVTPTGEPTEIKTSFVHDSITGVQTKVIRDVKKNTSNPQQPFRAETIYEYDALFNVVRTKEQFATGPVYKVSDSLYDEFRRVVRTVDYLSAYTDADISNDALNDTYYDARGNVTRSVDPNDLITAHEYDLLGRQIKANQPNGVIKKIEYDDASEVNPSANKPVIRHTSVVMDGASEITLKQDESFIDELGRQFLGRVYHSFSASPPYYEEKTWQYKSGRRWKSQDQYTKYGQLYHFWSYDSAGRVATYKAPKGGDPSAPTGVERVVNQYSYDGNNKVTNLIVTEWNEATQSAAPSYTITYTYDTHGRTISETCSGQNTHYYYDSHGRTRRQTFSSLGVENTTTFDLSGNVEEEAEKVSASSWRTVKHTTDYLGRVLTKTAPNPSGDPMNPAVTTTYVRDDYGQGRLEILRLPAITGTPPEYAYDYDYGGRVVYEWDPNNTQKEYVYHAQRGYLDYINIFPSTYPGAPPTSFGGPWGIAGVDYKYEGLGGGCGCSGGLQPVEIVTRQGWTNMPPPGTMIGQLTKVNRTYDALGRVTAETVWANWLQYNTSSDYLYNDSSNYKESFVYSDGKRRTSFYDANRRIIKVNSDVFTSEETVAEYSWQGSGLIARRDYKSTSTTHRAINERRFDTDDSGNPLPLQGWRNPTWNKWATTSPGGSLLDWNASYDAANRVATKKLGTPSAPVVMQYTFQYDLAGDLAGADYKAPDVGPPPDPPVYQFSDWTHQDYIRNSAGIVSQVSQCYKSGTGSQTCESSGYAPVRNERGAVTQVNNTHIFGYWYSTNATLTTVSTQANPQYRTLDSNGNTTQITFAYTRNDDPETLVPPACNDETATHNYEWTFKYDAWARLVSAQKNVTVYDCDDAGSLYYHSFAWTYDGFGRRIRTELFSYDPGNDAPIPIQTASMIDVNDSEGRIVQHGTVTYIHGPERMPAMAQAASGGAPQYFLNDVRGNAGAVLDCSDGSLDKEKSTTSCGDENPKFSGAQSGFLFNIYGNSYGYQEDGFRLVDNIYWTPFCIEDSGAVYDAEIKGMTPQAGPKEKLEKKNGDSKDEPVLVKRFIYDPSTGLGRGEAKRWNINPKTETKEASSWTDFNKALELTDNAKFKKVAVMSHGGAGYLEFGGVDKVKQIPGTSGADPTELGPAGDNLGNPELVAAFAKAKWNQPCWIFINACNFGGQGQKMPKGQSVVTAIAQVTKCSVGAPTSSVGYRATWRIRLPFCRRSFTVANASWRDGAPFMVALRGGKAREMEELPQEFYSE